MKSALRILFTAPGYKPAYRIGGPIFSVSALAEALVRKGQRVTVFATNCNMSEDLDVPVDCPQWVEGVEVWYFRHREIIKKMFPFFPYFSKSIGFLYAPAMANQLNQIVPSMNLVHTHLPFIYPTIAGARAAHLHQKPLFYHQRGVLCPDHLTYRSFKKKIYLKLIEGPILKKATSLIALTEYEYESYRKLKVDTQCYIIPNGIELDEYEGNDKEAIGSELGLDGDTLVILFMARLHPMKGIEQLLDAFIKIQNVILNVSLVVAGPDEYGMLPRWQDKVRSAGLEKRILFPGTLAGKMKNKILARADLFCLPSNAEGFSMAIVEALASGTAVMISPGCHFPEVETAGVGKVVEAKPEAMAETLIELLRDKKQLEAMGRKGRDFVSQKFSWDTIADDFIEVYREGIARYAGLKRS